MKFNGTTVVMDLVELHNPNLLKTFAEKKKTWTITRERFETIRKISPFADCHISKCETDWFVRCVQRFQVKQRWTGKRIDLLLCNKLAVILLLLPLSSFRIAGVVIYTLFFLFFFPWRAYFELSTFRMNNSMEFHTTNEFSWHSIHVCSPLERL